MPIHPLVGHSELREAIGRALQGGRVPQLMLLTGRRGVGKQRLALWIGQLLLCEQAGSEPCGVCRHCRMALELSHPDLHWFAPVARPKATEPDKQIEELEEALGQVMAERRAQSLYGPPDGLAGHFVATSRLLLRRAALTPAMGRRKVFIVGDAERLVPQEANPEAANALLKLFEEPPADTYILLTATDVHAVLPTIRSRAVPLRLRQLADSQIEELLSTRLDPVPDPTGLKERIAAAQGSVGAALAEEESAASVRRAALDLLETVMAGPVARSERALRQAPWSARGDFTALLGAVAETLSDAARASLGEKAVRPLSARALAGRPAENILEAERRVLAARETAQGNINPQLLLATLADELAEVL